MWILLSNLLTLAGALILAASLGKFKRLIAASPTTVLRRRWRLLKGLVLWFIAGYLGYALVLSKETVLAAELLEAVIFFTGACFVWLVAHLAWQMGQALLRVDLLEKENVTDPLTRIHNRRFLDRCLGVEIARARRYRTPLSILLLDIDHFKALNDRYGHQAGDYVLGQLARELSSTVRAQDVVGRYGGEEFLIIVPNTALSEAVHFAERLRETIAARRFEVPDMEGKLQEIRVTASIGVAALEKGTDDGERLLRTVDQRLYQAKGQGRNRVFPPPARPSAVEASQES